MPTGTCEICGCTEMNACPPTCHWRDRNRRYCSQCVGWLLPNPSNHFPNVLPYNLWPVRTLEPVPIVQSGRPVQVWIVDVRRIERDTLERIAFAVAPTVDLTAEEWLEWEGAERRPFAVMHTAGQTLVEALSLEQAAAMIEEYRATGRITGGKAFLRPMMTVSPKPEPGKARR